MRLARFPIDTCDGLLLAHRHSFATGSIAKGTSRHRFDRGAAETNVFPLRGPHHPAGSAVQVEPPPLLVGGHIQPLCFGNDRHAHPDLISIPVLRVWRQSR